MNVTPRRTRASNANKRPGAIVAPKPRQPAGTAKAQREAKASKKIADAEAREASIARVADFENRDMMREDMVDATPRPAFSPTGLSSTGSQEEYEVIDTQKAYVSSSELDASDHLQHDKKTYQPANDSPTEDDTATEDDSPPSPPPPPKRPSKKDVAREKAMAVAAKLQEEQAKLKAAASAGAPAATVAPRKSKHAAKAPEPAAPKKRSKEKRKVVEEDKDEEVMIVSDSEPETQQKTRDEIAIVKARIVAAQKKEDSDAKKQAQKEGAKKKKNTAMPKWPIPSRDPQPRAVQDEQEVTAESLNVVAKKSKLSRDSDVLDLTVDSPKAPKFSVNSAKSDPRSKRSLQKDNVDHEASPFEST